MTHTTAANDLVLISLDDLIPDPRNARSHNSRNLDAIAGSLKEFGQVENLVVQKGTNRIIGGHGRLEAMKAMGMTHAEVKLIDLTDAQASKLGLALNRTAELAEWDLDNLADVVDELRNSNIDLSDIGFSQKELDAVFNVKKNAQDEDDESDGESKIGDALTYSVVVDFATEKEHAKLTQELESRGFKCRMLIA